MHNLEEQFGQIDIYLFDQLLKGRIAPGMRIFDAGCGFGRNLVYFFKEGYEVFGADADPRAIASVRGMTQLPADNFRVERLEQLSFPASFADVVISSAVLHFARSDDHFLEILRGSWNALKPGGLFFCRLASSIGMENQVQMSGRYLVDEALLMRLTEELGGQMLDPLKTTVVQNQRCMTTWVLRKTRA